MTCVPLCTLDEYVQKFSFNCIVMIYEDKSKPHPLGLWWVRCKLDILPALDEFIKKGHHNCTVKCVGKERKKEIKRFKKKHE